MAEVESNNDAGLSSTAAAPVAGVSNVTVKVEMESEDEEDVFEVESILDSKIEGGEVLYRVRWKGYDSDGDTWEPEAHLADCKEVLLGFRRKQAEIQKTVKMEMPTLSPSDLFEADSEGEQSGQKVDSPPKKRKSSREEDGDLALEEMKKRKSKSGKSKEKSKAEAELSDGSSPELKPKKRLSESKEDLSNKKQKRDDLKESKKTKKEDVKDPKVKGKDELKDKMQKKDNVKECDPPGYARQVSEDSVSGSSAILTEEKKNIEEQEVKEPEPIQDVPDEMPSVLHCIKEEEDEEEVKVKKKKKHKRLKTERVEETMSVSDELQMDKKNTQKKQKSLVKPKAVSVLERLAPFPAPVQKGSRASSKDKGKKSVDSVPEEKEGKKTDPGRGKTRKKHDSEKQVKKKQKMVKTTKESKNIFNAFTVTPEDRHECTESPRIKEAMPLDYRPVEECKTKELKQVFKERQNTRDESEPWAFAASEGDQEVADPLSQIHDNTEMDTGTAKPRPKKKRRSYEAGFKLKVVSRAEESNNIIASSEFCVDEKQVRQWRKTKADLEKIPNSKKAQRGLTTSYGALEMELNKWVMECRQNGHAVTRMGIRLRALEMAKDDKYKAPGIENFVASAGWCSLFMNRFGLCLQQRTKISQPLPLDLEEKVMSFQSFIIRQRSVHNYGLGDIGNMDEIHMTFDLPSDRTGASLGDKTMFLRTGNDKNNFTVVLSCLANGTKLRPVVIFKRETLPTEVLFPPKITVRAHFKGLMDVGGTKKWLEEIWNGRPGAALMKPSLLVWDMFRAHTSEDIKQLARSSQVTLAVIPGGLTSVLQPIKVSLIKPFKGRVRKMWREWMSPGQDKQTKAANLTEPDIELIAKWVQDAWEDIPEDMVQRAFQKCGISNAMDDGEDVALYENDRRDGDDNVYAEIDVLIGHTDDEEESSFERF